MLETVLADAVLNALREEFLGSELLQDHIHEMRARWESAPNQHKQERRACTDRIATLDAERRRLSALVVSGKAPETVVRATEEREAEKRTAQIALDRLDAMARTRPAVDPERLQESLEEFVSALVYDLGQSPAKVQQTLGRLLTRPVVVYPTAEGGWRATLEASFAKLGGERADVKAELARVMCGAPGVTRTPGTQFRKLLLYPPELRGHAPSARSASFYPAGVGGHSLAI